MKHKVEPIVRQVIQELARLHQWEGLDDFSPGIERPKKTDHGDFSTNVAMVLAGQLKQKPRDLAELVVDVLKDHELFEDVSIAGPGFINLRLTTASWQQALSDISDLNFLRPNLGQGKKVLIEYVSANPTGPLHVGNARGGPLGDCLARIMSQCGYDVTTEYYVNDIGGQVDRLGASILHWMKVDAGQESELPEGGYFGPYVKELAQEAAAHPDYNYLGEPTDQAVAQLAEWGVKRLLDEISQDCQAIGSTFDRWIHEKDLRSEVDATLERLVASGKTQEHEGALWFVPNAGTEKESGRNIEDRESVLKKSDGEPTYFADDIICHVKRFEAGFEHIIDVWGANHHGHVPRVQAALAALGYDPKALEVVLYQYVRVCRGDEAIKMSKRAGNYVTAREVLEEVGADAMRFFLLQRAPSAHLDFDLELAKKTTSENPIYYIQYSHARICSVQRKAESHGLQQLDFAEIKTGLLDLPEELALVQFLFEYPEIIEKAALGREPHHIAYYLLDLARRFHAYYAQGNADPCYRVISDDIDRSQAKLYLLGLVQAILADGLRLLGLSAPVEMKSGE